MRNCLITRNPQTLKNIEDFDMVLFVGEDNVIEYVKHAERYRTPRQIYGMILAEPPHIAPNLSYFSNKINWTLSYRADADVKWVYGSVFDKRTKDEVPRDPMWRGFDADVVSNYVLKSGIPDLVKKKTKKVAWFVSNCDRVQSNRMQLANEISKHIPVDIYGKCGQLECTPSPNNDKCHEMVEQDYFFYLSFENALCKDYITEKAFRIMSRTIVPVVYNGADVTKLLPPKSYINAEDYATPKELADYLVFLADNPEEYLKYFWWKEYYRLGQLHYACYLCQQLNQRDPSTHIAPYASIEKWYKEDVCRSPRIRISD